MDISTLKLSVIVPTKNRAGILQRMLESLTKQTMDNDSFEVVIIDNGSTDHTREVCEKFRKEFPHYQYIFDETPGLHIGRNRGYQMGKADILVFADDDILVPKEWLEGFWEVFETTEAVEVAGGVIPFFDAAKPDWVEPLWQTMEAGKVLLDFSCIDLGAQVKKISPYYAFGGNSAIKRRILDATEGFHPDGMPDALLQFRGDGESYVARYITEHHLEVWYAPKATVEHIIPKNRLRPEHIQRVAFRSGISDAYTCLRYKKGRIVLYLLSTVKQSLMSGGMRKVKAKGHLKGCLFLLKHYMRDSRVREWIGRSNYLDQNGRIPAGK